FLYLPSSILFALQLQQMRAPHVSRTTMAVLDRVEMVHLAACALASVALLVYRLFRERSWEQQRQLQWMVFGLGGGYLPFLLLYGIPDIFGLRGPALLQSISVVPLALVPLTFAYAILRYKLWDIEVIVRDTISWTLTLLLGTIGFSLINLLISRGISEELSLARNGLMFISGLMLAGLLVPARSAISSVLERLQYRDAFGKRRALSGFGRELLHERDLGRLCIALLDGIEDGVQIAKANLYLAQGETLVAVHPEAELPDQLPYGVLGTEVWGRDMAPLSGVAMPGEPLSPATRLFVA